MKATIFNVQHFSIHDGPGIRTTVFFKGCPLRCVWCHNPEGLEKKRQLFFNFTKCALCGNCVEVCPNSAHVITPPTSDGERPLHLLDRSRCVVCGRCAEVCDSKVLEVSGREVDVADILAEVEKDRVFYESSGGGMTLSGGEPLAQPDAAIELLRLAKADGISTAVETSGYCDEDVLRSVAEYCDLFLLDFKESDETRHIEYTGVSNAKPLRSLELLESLGAKVVLRCPIIPGLNDRDDHFARIGQIAQSHRSVTEVNLEPYHPLGVSKARNLGLAQRYSNAEFMDRSTAKSIKIPTKKPVKVM